MSAISPICRLSSLMSMVSSSSRRYFCCCSLHTDDCCRFGQPRHPRRVPGGGVTSWAAVDTRLKEKRYLGDAEHHGGGGCCCTAAATAHSHANEAVAVAHLCACTAAAAARSVPTWQRQRLNCTPMRPRQCLARACSTAAAAAMRARTAWRCRRRIRTVRRRWHHD